MNSDGGKITWDNLITLLGTSLIPAVAPIDFQIRAMDYDYDYKDSKYVLILYIVFCEKIKLFFFEFFACLFFLIFKKVAISCQEKLTSKL
jgi:hypothetical protein